MTTSTATIAEWLLERITEDEAVALAAIPASSANWEPQSYRVVADGEWEVAEASVPSATHIARNDPARVLATCKAHRAIVEDYAEMLVKDVEYNEKSGRTQLAYGHVRLIASIYRDAPGFREEWAG